MMTTRIPRHFKALFPLLFAAVPALFPGLSLAQSTPASFTGEFWETAYRNNINDAIRDASGPPDATFRSFRVDYPQGNRNTQSASLPLRNFLGSDASSLTGAVNAPLTTSILKISGHIELTPGQHTFTVGSDDGFRLVIGGTTIVQHTGVRGFRTSSVQRNVGSGVLPFELYFFERAGNTGVEFFIDGTLATPAPKANVTTSKTVALHREDAAGCGVIPGSADPAAAAALPGACLEYRIAVDNSGPGTAYGVMVEDLLDGRMIFEGASHSGFVTSDPGFVFETPPPAADCGATTCRIAIREAVVAPGGQGTITIRSSLK